MSWDAPFDSSYDLDLHVLEILNQGYKSDENEIPEAGQPCRNALRAAASPGQLPVNDSQRLGAEPSPLSLPPELSSSRNCRGAGRGAAAPNHNEAALRALVQALQVKPCSLACGRSKPVPLIPWKYLTQLSWYMLLQEKLKILEPEPPHPGDRVAGSKPIELAPRAAFRGVANTAKQPSSQRPLSAQLHGRTSSSAVGLLGAPVLKGAKAVEERTGCWPGRSGAAGAAPGRGDIRHAGTPRAAERNGCRGAGGPDAGGACAASQQQQQEQQKQQLEGLSRAALLTRVRKAEQEVGTQGTLGTPGTLPQVLGSYGCTAWHKPFAAILCVPSAPCLLPLTKSSRFYAVLRRLRHCGSPRRSHGRCVQRPKHLQVPALSSMTYTSHEAHQAGFPISIRAHRSAAST